MKLPTAQEMQALDKCAIENFGIPGIVLMENAGLGTVRMMERTLGTCQNTFACIIVGPGNNGGDGLVIGRHLHQRGCKPFFFLLVNPDKLQGDAALNMAIVKNLKLPFHVIDTTSRVHTIPVLYKQIESRGLPCYSIVDAVFGTGLTRPVEDHFASVINLINERDFAHDVPVVSVDCPSGMDADSGKVLGTCIRSDQTATYGFAKPGHYIHDSRELTGKLEVIDIGIPIETLDSVPISNELLDNSMFSNISSGLVRKNSSHKGDHGHLLILGGSTGKTGAAILSAKGALRSGCGLVSLAVPNKLNNVIENNLIEAMTISLPHSDTTFSYRDCDTILQSLEGKRAVVIGPGIGTSYETSKLLLELYQEVRIPMVLDADALNILAANPEKIEQSGGQRIFTPHPGELSRILGWPIQQIQDNRLEAARQACKTLNNGHSDNIVVVKGAGTIISAPGYLIRINTSGNPGMATGGMGDVLAGMIGALICQGMNAFDATSAAAYLHGAAADSLYEKYGAGYTASEVSEVIPVTLKSLLP
ncbi:NAD(P)H-hydrate dehydratase [Desulfosediminicola flagellatus]|uniref:NAD(P)H-hydrate dehydratase n=1 Tax=Desulfosediminicola flagellatus TaxID=2569541 RepID=UPI0010AC2DDF|nr:NAD(P)H-hydrate dehydratase [Desulfosediminicola flagellatus]